MLIVSDSRNPGAATTLSRANAVGGHSRQRALLTSDHIVTRGGRTYAAGMAMREPLLDPTGASERDVNTTLAPRPGSLRELTAGLLENTKPNAVPLLQAVGRELTERYGVREVRMFRKGYFGTPVEESVVQQMLHKCDFVVAGIGD